MMYVTVWRLIFLLSRTPLNSAVLYAGEGGRHGAKCSSLWERGAVGRSGYFTVHCSGEHAVTQGAREAPSHL